MQITSLQPRLPLRASSPTDHHCCTNTLSDRFYHHLSIFIHTVTLHKQLTRTEMAMSTEI